MPAPTPPPPAAPTPAELAEVLLNASLTGIVLLRPVYAADGAEIVDFDWEQLNPAAQQQLRLPARPAESFLTLFPMARAAGVFEFYRAAFLSGLACRQNLYQHEWLDGYYLLAAQRCAGWLVVSFSDTNDQPRTAGEEALRASQAATAAPAQQREELYQVFEQASVIVALLRGRGHFFYYCNPAFQELFPGRPLAGRLYADAMPEIVAAGLLLELD